MRRSCSCCDNAAPAPKTGAGQEESQAQAEAIGYRRGMIWSRTYLGFVVAAQGARTVARTLLAEALQLAWGDRAWIYFASCLDGLENLAVLEDAAERAVRLHAAAMALRDRLGVVPKPSWRPSRLSTKIL